MRLKCSLRVSNNKFICFDCPADRVNHRTQRSAITIDAHCEHRNTQNARWNPDHKYWQMCCFVFSLLFFCFFIVSCIIRLVIYTKPHHAVVHSTQPSKLVFVCLYWLSFWPENPLNNNYDYVLLSARLRASAACVKYHDWYIHSFNKRTIKTLLLGK